MLEKLKKQRGILKNADTGTDIVVNVKYNLKNSTATDGEVRLINFSYTVIPEIEAVYPGGDPVLKQYLKKNAIDKIAEPVANALKLTTVRFTINEEGQVTNARITTTSEDAKIDNLLLETINKMPKWKPAENAQGIKVKQEFEFRVGNSFGC